MPYDNSGMLMPVAPHMHPTYGSMHSHFQNTYHQPPPPMYKSDIMMPHTLPSVNTVPVNPQPTLSPISSLNSTSSSGDYSHMPPHAHMPPPQHQYHHSPPMDHTPPPPPPPQEVPNYNTNVTPMSMPSPPSTVSPATNLRFEIYLEAPTAAAQRIDETPITYLNKGQYYSMCMQDQEKADVDYTTTIKLMFHEDTYRKMSSTYWSFWLSQQAAPKTARAIDLDKAASTGIKNVELKLFDRVQFQWNGRKPVKIFVRFNCLSTDFSRIKGVKGIPLRIHSETRNDSGQVLERAFSKIKLFRDKGAERKNKDDQKHLEKMCEKMRAKRVPGKAQETTPMMMMYAQPSAVTVFNELTTPIDPADDDEVMSLSDTLANLESDTDGGELMTLHLGKRRRPALGPDFLEPLDCDPTYVPVRKRRAVLCIYVKLPGEQAYRAVYLHHLTAQDLIAKLSEKIDLQGQQIMSVCRFTKRAITVRVDDELVNQMEDEQDMEVEYNFAQDGGVHLSLKF